MSSSWPPSYRHRNSTVLASGCIGGNFKKTHQCIDIDICIDIYLHLYRYMCVGVSIHRSISISIYFYTFVNWRADTEDRNTLIACALWRGSVHPAFTSPPPPFPRGGRRARAAYSNGTVRARALGDVVPLKLIKFSSQGRRGGSRGAR